MKYFLIAIIGMIATITFATNPVIPYPFTADPSLHKWSDGRFYIYGSHDKDQPKVWDMEDYHIFSSDNLVDWKDHGMVLNNRQTPWDGPLWAPDAAEKNGKYYFYFPQGSHIGVCKSDTPIGPLSAPVSLYTMPKGYAQAYDPAVFSYQGKDYMMISERKSDDTPFYPALFELDESMMKIVPGSKVEMPTMDGFHEGPFVFERAGKVYIIGGGYASLRYWMADDLLGPYEAKGDFFTGNDTFTVSKTAHGSVMEYDGKWYLACHYDVFPDGPYRRTTCIEYLHFNEDGTIHPVTITRKGIDPILPKDWAGLTLKSKASGKYICAERNGNGPLAAKQVRANECSEMYVMPVSDGEVGLVLKANYKYLCAGDDGKKPLKAERNQVGGDWETFTFEQVKKNEYAIKAKANGKYVRCDKNGAPLISSSETIGPEETFEVNWTTKKPNWLN